MWISFEPHKMSNVPSPADKDLYSNQLCIANPTDKYAHQSSSLLLAHFITPSLLAGDVMFVPISFPKLSTKKRHKLNLIKKEETCYNNIYDFRNIF